MVREVFEKRKRGEVIPSLKKDKKEALGNRRPLSFTSTPAKVMEQLSLDTIARHLKEKKVMGSSQRGFPKGTCAHPAFCGAVTGPVDEGRAAGALP